MSLGGVWKRFPMCVCICVVFLWIMHGSLDLQIFFSTKTTLKLGLTALFTYLKIVLL